MSRKREATMTPPSEEVRAAAREVESALTKISKVALKGVPDDAGYIFYANEVRDILRDFVAQQRAEAALAEADMAIANVQEAIDTWKSWNTDDGFEAMNTAVIIRERLKGHRAALAKEAQGDETKTMSTDAEGIVKALAIAINLELKFGAQDTIERVLREAGLVEALDAFQLLVKELQWYAGKEGLGPARMQYAKAKAEQALAALQKAGRS
jgi:hypothetical protein